MIMKLLNFVLPLTFLIGSSASARDITLLDYRKDLNDRQPPTIPIETEKRVLSKVVKASDRACSGNLTPSVIDAISGAFTAAETNQTAYLVDIGDACHPRLTGTKRLAIFAGEQLITSSEVHHIISSIKRTTDIDNDGRQELVLQGASLGQGYLGFYAKILNINAEGIAVLGEFKRVYANNFGTLDPKLWQEASVISLQRGSDGRIVFKRQNYLANCTKVSTERRDPTCQSYRLVSTGEPDF
jgi:hypothetical protein